ncbi:sugar phosphate isomerase/epimerase family protein [Haloarcula nitratireducens]|uniref:Sugar phosphate isomerase/epimerase n=1 Tax=Haloarcula nitratireducens TaxID=2487749 RepID=A0AAW4PHF2_9EURY|nr:sugar phosphate isomerase/epimerase family protein [Halomicroarcula nitratireducens]MBX0296875.1 sugar phosphate isomerase/epimerase [Halomicroarcula nitratireducens]
MGVGYTTIMYGEESLLDGLEEISACGYDGVETSLGEISTVGKDRFQQQLDDCGLDLYCTMGEWLESQAAADRIADGAETAAELGAPYLGILPPHRGTTEDADLERWLEQVCDAAASAGVTPVLHHHGATLIEQPDEIASWLDRAPDNLGLLWDTSHHYPYGENYPEGDVTDGIERFADDIEYVHLKDVAPGDNFDAHVEALSNGERRLDTVFWYYNAFTDLGKGVIDFEGVDEALDQIGYDGHITVEIENQTEDTRTHAEQNYDYWRAIAE